MDQLACLRHCGSTRTASVPWPATSMIGLAGTYNVQEFRWCGNGAGSSHPMHEVSIRHVTCRDPRRGNG